MGGALAEGCFVFRLHCYGVLSTNMVSPMRAVSFSGCGVPAKILRREKESTRRELLRFLVAVCQPQLSDERTGALGESCFVFRLRCPSVSFSSALVNRLDTLPSP